MNTQQIPAGALYVLMPAPAAGSIPDRGTEPERREPLAEMDAVSLYSAPWVRLSRWCSLTDDTSDAVHARRRAGKWINGKHCRVADDGKLWINLRAASDWVAGTTRSE